MTANARDAHSRAARLRAEAYRRGFLEGRAMALIEVLELAHRRRQVDDHADDRRP